jgi:hypothetical protein
MPATTVASMKKNGPIMNNFISVYHTTTCARCCGVAIVLQVTVTPHNGWSSNFKVTEQILQVPLSYATNFILLAFTVFLQ